MKFLIIHGPNLNLLGERETAIYGAQTLAHINEQLSVQAAQLGVHIDCRQTNHEGQIIDWLQESRNTYSGVVLNPGGFTHTSVAIRDAVAAINIPVIEVHLSNIFARESFRHHSLVSPVCAGTISGLGVTGYRLALEAVFQLTAEQNQ
jgi:3-dehydroquinate dehydratase-2